MNTRALIPGNTHWLAEAGLLAVQAVDQLCDDAMAHEQPLVTYLVAKDILDGARIARTASRLFRLPLLDLDCMDHAHIASAGLDPALIRKHRIIPLARSGQTITVGLADPVDESGLAEIRFMTGCRPVITIVEEHKLEKFIRGSNEQEQPGMADYDLLDALDTQDATDGENGDDDDDSNNPACNESPIMHFVNKLLTDAIRQDVSDIHLETFERFSRVRFRQDGLLREVARPPVPLGRKFISRLKIMGQLDIAEKRLPQDGRFRMKVSDSKSVDFRVSTLPALWGEKVVLRIQDHNPVQLDLETLGYSHEHKQLYLEALNRQHGLILVTGPTGSGKSMSLYAGLNHLNTLERNISTVEDPVEIHMDGINQVSINHQIGLTFAESLRAFLRQDPDVLMVGEIRDSETAEIAVRAAQTGHLVLSTLHTNNCADTVTRLLDMGTKAMNLGTSLSLVIAQRLLRRLCPTCKKQVAIPHNVLISEGISEEKAKIGTFFAPMGCNQCQGGYRGRTGIYELLPITEKISRVIMSGGNSKQIADLALDAGLNTLRQSALEKASQGITSLAEVNRVT